MQGEGPTNEGRHYFLLLHNQAHDKRGIAESLHAYITRARLTACEVGKFLREISRDYVASYPGRVEEKDGLVSTACACAIIQSVYGNILETAAHAQAVDTRPSFSSHAAWVRG